MNSPTIKNQRVTRPRTAEATNTRAKPKASKNVNAQRLPSAAPAAPAPQHGLQAQIAARNLALAQIAAELKQELLGIDDVIDRVIDTLRAWYVMPQLIERPVIICLWGLTGTGKTQLVRSLTRKLGFYDRFVEVQMDGFSNGMNSWEGASISSILEDSCILENTPGILLLDEFQRFRTLDEDGKEVAVKRYQDVWTLLSDGRLSPSASFLMNLEVALADAHYEDERRTSSERKSDAKRKLRIDSYDARRLKRLLKLKESLLDIMAWPPERIQAEMLRLQDSSGQWDTDYSKLLIFVCGNLDEMYESLATRVQDCDTDADIFYHHTRRLSLIDVKSALAKRFKPEQVARLGNQHVIYPSLTRHAYAALIDRTCAQYIQQMHSNTGLEFDIGQDVRDEIYANGVFPAQGTRPLFSTLHAVLGTPLVNAAVWALSLEPSTRDQKSTPVKASQVHVRMHSDGRQLRLIADNQEMLCPVALDVRNLRQRNHADFRALLAVHEAGHGLVHALLFHHTPQELRINVASFEGGYALLGELKSWSRRNWEDRIAVCLAGRAAETLVFGAHACSSGAAQDLALATEYASRYVRHLAYAGHISHTDAADGPNGHFNTNVDPTNHAMEALLQTQMQRASELLHTHANTLLILVRELMQHGEINRQRLAELLGVPPASDEPVVLTNYAWLLENFARQQQPCKPEQKFDIV